MNTDRVTLPDGRNLEYYVSGPLGGLPLVFHHGTPGAATPFRVLERAAHARGFRIVIISRPGYSESDRHINRDIADVVPDVAAVLAAVGAERCVVAGWSGGGPHALACAARLPRTAATLVIAGVAPFGANGLDWTEGMGEDNVAEFAAAVAGADELGAFLQPLQPHFENVDLEGIVSGLSSLLPEVDRAVLTEEFGEDMAASFRAAVRSGMTGWIDDDLAFVKPWGFDLDEITTPVTIWQGSADLMVPFAHGQWLSSRLPHAVAHLIPGEGHLSVGIGAIDQMLDELLSAAG